MPTKREFILGLSRAGGVGAAVLGLQALGLARADAQEHDLSMQPAGGRGAKVVILGGGVGGLACAWELGKRGYDCTVLEARGRVGGRNWSIRGGDRIEMTDGSRQDVAFDPGLYWNAGPARISAMHKRLLGYCAELGVRLEVEVNSARSARLYNPELKAGAPLEMRQAVNDTRGVVSELLAKAIDRGALDQEIGAQDRERVFAFLKQYGDLTPDRLYKGSSRAGWTTEPGAVGVPGATRTPVSLQALLDLDLWNGVIFEDIVDQQATMFQPVGGMDRIPRAFEARLGAVVRKSAPVTAIRRTGEGVRVEYLEGPYRKPASLAADYCIVTLPLSVLRTIESDFSPSYKSAIAQSVYHESVKVAWQSRRFWEQDFGIYGGISWVKGVTNMVWYPSGDLFSPKGVLIGAYASNAIGEAMAGLPLAEQFALSRAMVEGLHPGYGRELEYPAAIAWKKIPFALGAAPLDAPSAVAFKVLSRPDGPFFFTGDYLSHLGNWQEASLSSAHRTLSLLDERRRAKDA